MSFFLMTLFLSGYWDQPKVLIVWAAVVFVSVMIHELGHAMMGRAFGLVPSIDLHGMGGTTSWPQGRDVSRAKSIAISFAGPGVGLVTGALVVLYLMARGAPEDELAKIAVSFALFVNIGWGVLNLLPILPLDGGNIMRAAIGASKSIKREKMARIISIVTAIGATGLAILFWKNWWAILLGAMFAYQNFKALREAQTLEEDEALRADLDAAYKALEREDGVGVLAHAEPVLARAKSSAFKAEAIHLAAYGFLLTGRVAEADKVIAMIPAGYKPHASLLELRARYAPPGS